MSFAACLEDSLRIRGDQLSSELAKGDSLRSVLTRDLLAVEAVAVGDPVTSILLLDPNGKTLWHGAAPNLPQSYCDAIDGAQIGPTAGSCGTAAFFDRPVYVTDIESDPLWAEYKHLALPHGLRACWSTPIHGPKDEVVGTFAVYHREPGSPTQSQIDAIRMITDHVANAIVAARSVQDCDRLMPSGEANAPRLKVVGADTISAARHEKFDRLLQIAEELQSLAGELSHFQQAADSQSDAEAMRTVVADCRRLVSVIRNQVDSPGTKS